MVVDDFFFLKLASSCFHALLQPYLTGIMEDNEYYKVQPSGRSKDHPGGFNWVFLSSAKLPPGWSLDLPDGDDMLFQTYTQPIIKLISGGCFFLF